MTNENLPNTTEESTPEIVKTDLDTIAEKCQNDISIADYLGSSTLDNMKSFLIVYARSQLTRIIKLTKALDEMETALLEEAMKPENISPETLMATIKTIQNSLNSAINLVKQVTSDESFINVIIDNSKVINNNLNQVNNYAINNARIQLPSQKSRAKVRDTVSLILAKLEEEEGESNAPVDPRKKK